jgi:hypothetical protein
MIRLGDGTAAVEPANGVRVRALGSAADYAACVRLQLETWGEGFAECVPASLLKVGQLAGGVSAGAFDADGLMVGFVFGLTGLRDGRLMHWSHMLAVRPEFRDHGVGLTFVAWQQPIGCGGVAVFPGDVVVVDADGAVLIPAAQLEMILKEGPDQERMEGWIMDEVDKGTPLPGLYPMNAETKARYDASKGKR